MKHKNKKIGIAISLYDKFEELQLLLDIIKRNWQGNYIVTVCSNHPEGQGIIDRLNLPIDKFIQGENIPYDASKPIINLTYRVIDTVKKSCQAAMEMGADIVMHVHADAWPLNERKFLDLVEKMESMDKKFFARGFGYGYYRGDAPLGHLDDMFFIFDSHFMRKVGFFDFDALNFLSHKLTIHGILSTQVLSRVGLQNFYLYNDLTDIETWGGQKKIMPYDGAKPLIFDKKNCFLHVHRGEFLEGYGEILQAIFLKNYCLTDGECIKRFIGDHYKQEKEVYSHLKKIENNLDRKLMLLGYDIKEFGQCFTSKESAVKNITLRIIFNNYFLRLGMFIVNLFLKIVGKKKISRHYQKDTIWPKNIETFYREKIIFKDFKEILDKKQIFFLSEVRNNKDDKRFY
jgi:hypothetical protein